MDYLTKLDEKRLRIYNLRKYNGIPPSMEVIESAMKKSGIKKMETFEHSFGIPIKTIIRYRMGDRGLPPTYWHIFYDFDNLKYFYKNFRSEVRSDKITNKASKSNKIFLNDLSDRFKKQR